MSKHKGRPHEAAVRHAPAPPPRRHGKAMRGRKPAPEMTHTARTAVEFKPAVIDVVEVEFLNDPVEALADNVAITGFEDEDL